MDISILVRLECKISLLTGFRVIAEWKDEYFNPGMVIV